MSNELLEWLWRAIISMPILTHIYITSHQSHTPDPPIKHDASVIEQINKGINSPIPPDVRYKAVTEGPKVSSTFPEQLGPIVDTSEYVMRAQVVEITPEMLKQIRNACHD
jgi:hypothetical protein